MVDENDGTAAESRPPTLTDLVALCRALNEENAQYIIIGGMAIIQAGFVRATEAIDLRNAKKMRWIECSFVNF